ncbi:chromate transporter [Deinococcus sp.]|uniref:chromate transporter n=1 Tax=Deinococcus sp. TaxID=47478 RepID=UPI0025C0DF5B|nr:chromate transporter [Deinococcus sp.]
MSAPAPPPAPHLPSPVAVTHTDLLRVFAGVAMAGIGGGLPAHMRRAALERAWMTELDFAESFTLAQLTPGPNAVNLAAMIGARLRGWTGALATVVGVLTPGLIAMLGMTVVTLGLPGGLPAPLQSGLRGAACAALAVMLTAALPVLRVVGDLRGGWVLALATFAGIGLLRLNLLPVVAVVVGAGLILHRPGPQERP